MALVTQTNIPSLNAQRNLNIASFRLDRTFARLSSGMRITEAADDAAGMAIATNLQAQVMGLNQAVRNAGDGLSMLGVGESAIVEQTNLLLRIRELAVQSASDSNSATNRNSLNDEVAQLKAEIDRIAQSTQFNGLNLLDGSFVDKVLQIGANNGSTERMTISMQSTRAASLGTQYQAVNATIAPSLTPTASTVSAGSNAAVIVDLTGVATDAKALADKFNGSFDLTGVKATATNTVSVVFSAGTTGTASSYTMNGVNMAWNGGGTIDEAVASINAATDKTGVTAKVNGTKIDLSTADGSNITLTASTPTAGVPFVAGTYVGNLTYSSDQAFVITGGGAGISATGAFQASVNVKTVDITTRAGAQTAIDTIDRALNQINSRRAAIGAQVNRLDSVIANLQAASENTAAARSRIADTDYAAETANLAKDQILQQAAAAVLAQANAAPQLALTLLR